MVMVLVASEHYKYDMGIIIDQNLMSIMKQFDDLTLRTTTIKCEMKFNL